METDSKPDVTPKLKYKSFTYRNHIEWLGGRAGSLASEGKTAFRVASPPEFRGEAGVWCPEDLLVASVNTCVMATFAAYLDRLKLPVSSYACSAEGLLEFADGKYRITRVTLRPKVAVRGADAVAAVEKALRDAHDNCIVTSSIRGTVILEPEILAQT